MQVQLGTIVKRLNSTKNAPSSWSSRTGVLKEACDILSPVIEFDFGNSNPCGYNYMYIADFGRYYYVTWEFKGSAHWYARGSVDVLASAKTAIGMSPKYVMRAASESNEYIVDTMYPAECSSNDTVISVSSGIVENPVQGGSFVVGVVGGSNWGGAISYFIMDYAGMNQLISTVFNNNQYNNGGVPYIWDDLIMKLEDIPVKILVNPAQYITSIMWYPTTLPNTGAQSNIRFAWFDSGVGALSAGTRLKYLSYNIDYSSIFSGADPKYRYASPFAQYSIRVPGFGVIALPSSEIISGTSLTVQIVIDIYTGDAICNIIKPMTTPTPRYIARATGKMGVPYAIGGYNHNYAGALGNGIQAITGAANAAMTKNPLAAIGAGASAIESAADFFGTEVQTIGGAGSTADIFGDIIFECRRSEVAEEHIVEFGRPLCKIKTLNTLTGFIQCANGDIQCDLTDSEKQQIKNYLEAGFYYE